MSDLNKYTLLLFEKIFEKYQRYDLFENRNSDEYKILQEIIKCLSESKESDIVYRNYTQKEIYEKFNKSIVCKVEKFNFTFYASVNLDSKIPLNSVGAFSVIDKTIYLKLSDFGIKLKNNLLEDKQILIDNLNQNSELIQIAHHEIAHKLFFDKFKSIDNYFKFCEKYLTKSITYNEYNSLLSELYQIAMASGKSLKTATDVKAFYLGLLFESTSSQIQQNLLDLLDQFDKKKVIDDLVKIYNRETFLPLDKLLKKVHQSLLTSKDTRCLNNINDLYEVMKDFGLDYLKVKSSMNPNDFYEKCKEFVEMHKDPKLKHTESVDEQSTLRDENGDVITTLMPNIRPEEITYKEDLPKIINPYKRKLRIIKELLELELDDDKENKKVDD